MPARGVLSLAQLSPDSPGLTQYGSALSPPHDGSPYLYKGAEHVHTAPARALSYPASRKRDPDDHRFRPPGPVTDSTSPKGLRADRVQGALHSRPSVSDRETCTPTA